MSIGDRYRALDAFETAVERGRLNLNDLVPAWERKLPHPIHQPELDSLLRRDEDVAVATRSEDFIGKRRALAQDIFRAKIIRQRSVK